MAELIEVSCPCCQSTLHIDPENRRVIHHQQPVKKPIIDDLAEAARNLQGEAARRNEAFEKSFASHQASGKVMEQKFEELLKKAKEDKADSPPKRAFDFD